MHLGYAVSRDWLLRYAIDHNLGTVDVAPANRTSMAIQHIRLVSKLRNTRLIGTLVDGKLHYLFSLGDEQEPPTPKQIERLKKTMHMEDEAKLYERCD